MNLKLESKLALVTGSTAGIGLAIAAALAGEGARVIINGRTPDRVEAAMKKLRTTNRDAKLEALPQDVTTAAGVAEAGRRSLSRDGRARE